MSLTKIISGGQTGADQGGWDAAKALRIFTGGEMPRHFRTERGYSPHFKEFFGVTESYSAEYPPRTVKNVKQSDGTLIIGNVTSRGSQLTIKLCTNLRKPYFPIPFPLVEYPLKAYVNEFQDWLQRENIRVLNVAGNRESKNPGIFKFTSDFLVEALSVREVSKKDFANILK